MSIRTSPWILILLSWSSFASAQTWQSIHPSGPENAVGGLVNELAFADSGEAYLLSSLGYLNLRPSSDQPWIPVTVTLDGQPVRLSGLHVGTGEPAFLLGRVNPDRLVMSDNGGMTWSELALPTSESGVPGWIQGFGSAASLTDTIYYSVINRVFFSTDGGSSWSEQTTSAPQLLWNLQIHPLSASTLIASAGGDFVISGDSGSNWSTQTNGIPGNSNVSEVGLDPTNLNTYYAATYHRAYKSTDGAQNWNLVLTGDNNSIGFNQFTVDPNNPSVVFAAYGAVGQGAVFRSINGGLSWTEHTESSGQGSYRRVDIDDNGAVIAGGDQGVVSSSDGINFHASNAGYNDFYSIFSAVAPSDNDVIYACGQAGGVIFTQDGGLTWEKRNNGLELSNVWSCAVDSNDSMRAYYASNSGMFKTTNGGLLWSLVDIDISQFDTTYSVSIAPTDSDRLYVRTGTGLYTTADGGDSWSQVLDGSYFQTCAGAYCPIVVALNDPSIVYVGTRDAGLLKSVNAGMTWQVIDDELPNLFVSSIALDPNNSQRLVLGLDDHKVVESVDAGLTWEDITYQLPPYTRAIEWTAIDPFTGDIYSLLSGYRQVFRLSGDTNWWEQVGVVDFETSGYAQQIIPSTQHRGRLFLQATELFSFDFDSDSDGIIDSNDNCVNQANVEQVDTNSDGFGNRCDPDFDNNGVVNFLDINIFVAAFLSQPGSSNWNPDADMNNDGTINFIDFSVIQEFFLNAPGPSGLAQ